MGFGKTSEHNLVLLHDLASLQVLYVNRQAELMFGFTSKDVEAGLNGSALMALEEFGQALDRLVAFVGESRSNGTPYVRSGRQDVFEQHLRRKDGRQFRAETQTSFVLDGRDVPVRMLTIVRDISHRD